MKRLGVLRMSAALIVAFAPVPIARAGAAGAAKIASPDSASSIPFALGPPREGPGGAVIWGPPAPRMSAADSVAFWATASGQPALRAAALHHLATLALAAGDTARADSLWAQPDLAASVWAWEALRPRTDLALARGEASRADSLLEAASRDGWPDPERAAWLALRVRLRAALRDTTRAMEFARQALRVYPSQPPTARALGTLDTLLRARGDTLAVADEIAAAEADVLRGDRASAARRLRRALPGSEPEARPALAERLAEVERGARHFVAAEAAVRVAIGSTRADSARARALLELARIHRDAGRPDSAIAAFGASADLARDPTQQETALWERGRAAEDAGRWESAGLSFAAVAELGRMRRADGVFRSGLMLFASGRADSARVVWALATDEASRFWRAIAGRAAERAASDSVLATIAARPGYSFYAVAARETLGLSAWPGRVAEDSCGAAGCAVVRAAQALAAAGAGEEALFLIARWAAGDARAGAGGPAPGDLLAASRLAFEMGRPATGTGYAERALRMPAAGPPATQWATTPWAYPPAFGRLLSAAADHAPGLEPALLAALVRQESRFDLRARSARDALGLMQLKLATAREVARELHVAAPSESSLFDPAINVRLGVRYLERLLHRFDGDVVAALCAYNAGPSTLGTAWRSLVERGGDALLCELGANSDARDYAKKILSGRQAYRELRPRSSAGE